jgi:hypothetical protein
MAAGFRTLDYEDVRSRVNGPAGMWIWKMSGTLAFLTRSASAAGSGNDAIIATAELVILAVPFSCQARSAWRHLENQDPWYLRVLTPMPPLQQASSARG